MDIRPAPLSGLATRVGPDDGLGTVKCLTSNSTTVVLALMSLSRLVKPCPSSSKT